MTKQQITIEVDVPEGWELTGEYRKPKAGEYFVGGVEGCEAKLAHIDFVVDWFIIRKAYQFPTWTSANWLAMDQDGHWCFYQNEPQIGDDYWWAEGYSLEVNSLLDFTPPPCADWRQSKRRRPES